MSSVIEDTLKETAAAEPDCAIPPATASRIALIVSEVPLTLLVSDPPVASVTEAAWPGSDPLMHDPRPASEKWSIPRPERPELIPATTTLFA